MKKSIILIAIACVLLTGCSTSYNYSSSKITIYKIYEDEKDYSLLSVRGDSAIVVLDWKEKDVSPVPFSHTEVIKKDSIIRILREHSGRTYVPYITEGLAGLALGPFVIRTADYLARNIGTFALYLFIGEAFVCTAGYFSGRLFTSPKIITPARLQDWNFLRRVSAYPDKEPDEMQYIK